MSALNYAQRILDNKKATAKAVVTAKNVQNTELANKIAIRMTAQREAQFSPHIEALLPVWDWALESGELALATALSEQVSQFHALIVGETVKTGRKSPVASDSPKRSGKGTLTMPNGLVYVLNTTEACAMWNHVVLGNKADVQLNANRFAESHPAFAAAFSLA